MDKVAESDNVSDLTGVLDGVTDSTSVRFDALRVESPDSVADIDDVWDGEGSGVLELVTRREGVSDKIKFDRVELPEAA